MVGQEGFEPPLTPLRYYGVEDHSGTVPFIKVYHEPLFKL
jgi:hypothetical protein